MHTYKLIQILLSAVLTHGYVGGRDDHLVAARLTARQMTTAQDITCAQSMILAQGISLNIADQQQELATANQMATLLAAQQPVDQAAWAQLRTALLQFVNNGIAIRETNQLITPAGNAATPGLAIVANAQLGELGLASNLTETGADDVQGNMQIVSTLQMDFKGGIQQNMKNMADATTGCGNTGTAPAAAASSTPSTSAAGGGNLTRRRTR